MMQESLRNRMMSVIQALPQRKQIRDTDLQIWVDSVLENQPNNALFLVNRLGHIGGSDIGVLVQALRNRSAQYISDNGHSHRSDFDIVNDKLLRTIPQVSTGGLKRGSIFEKAVAKEYEQVLRSKYKSVVRRTDIKEAIVSNASKVFPWARVQVDDVFQVDGKLILVDYKIPSENGFKQFKYLEPLMYQCQVLLGSMIASELGYQIDELYVLPFDTENCEFLFLNVEQSEELKSEIKEAGEYYYGLVLEGKMPPPNFPNYSIQGQDDLDKDLVKLINIDSVLRLLSLEIAKVQETIAPQLDSGLKKVYAAMQHNENFRINVGCQNLTGTHKRTLDKASVKEFLLEKGFELSEVEKASKRSDQLIKLLKKVLPKEDEHEQFYTKDYQLNIGLIRDKSGPRFEFRSIVSDELASKITSIVGEMSPVMLEHIILKETPAAISVAQQKQLNTLQRLIDNAPNEAIQTKAEKALRARARLYSSTINENENSQKVSSSNKSTNLEVIQEPRESRLAAISDLIKFHI